MRSFLHAIWTIGKKDLRVWARMRVLIVASMLVPLSYVLVVYLGSAAVSRSPVAVVNLDAGPVGAHMVQSLVDADVFRVSVVSTRQAQVLYDKLDVAAIITIPGGFFRAGAGACARTSAGEGEEL